jgi:tetratricopeptide (TPR) repeat protein
VQVPPTVQRVVLARTDLLDKDCHDTIAAASVVGRRFALPVLTSVLEGDVPVERAVTELCRLDLLRPAGRDFFQFKHGLIQDTVYRSLLLRRRKALHERVGRALERGSVEPTGELARELGRHFAAAELADEAVRYLASAAEQARQEYANEEALGMLTSAISQAENALAREEPGRWSDVMRDLEEQVGRLHDLIADFSSARSSYQRALTLTGAGDALRRARLHRRIAQTWTLQRRYDDATGALDAADSALRHVADQAEKWQEVIAAGIGRAEIAYWLNDTDGLASVLTALRPVVDAHGTPRQRADFYWQAVTWAYRSNRFVTTDAVVHDALAAFDATLELDDPDSTAWGHFYLGIMLLWRGELDGAEVQLQSALRFADESGTVLLQARCLCYLMVAARRRADVDRAAELVESTERATAAAGLVEYTAAAMATRSWLAWRRGQFATAR